MTKSDINAETLTNMTDDELEGMDTTEDGITITATYNPSNNLIIAQVAVDPPKGEVLWVLAVITYPGRSVREISYFYGQSVPRFFGFFEALVQPGATGTAHASITVGTTGNQTLRASEAVNLGG